MHGREQANQKLKGLKVFPVSEIVTYGFDPRDAPLNMRGTHLNPEEWNTALQEDNTICLDVRNFNESLIGKFVPPGDQPVTGAPGKVTDMRMRRRYSTVLKKNLYTHILKKNTRCAHTVHILMHTPRYLNLAHYCCCV